MRDIEWQKLPAGSKIIDNGACYTAVLPSGEKVSVSWTSRDAVPAQRWLSLNTSKKVPYAPPSSSELIGKFISEYPRDEQSHDAPATGVNLGLLKWNGKTSSFVYAAHPVSDRTKVLLRSDEFSHMGSRNSVHHLFGSRHYKGPTCFLRTQVMEATSFEDLTLWCYCWENDVETAKLHLQATVLDLLPRHRDLLTERVARLDALWRTFREVVK